jgi:hypothetical protein
MMRLAAATTTITRVPSWAAFAAKPESIGWDWWRRDHPDAARGVLHELGEGVVGSGSRGEENERGDQGGKVLPEPFGPISP